MSRRKKIISLSAIILLAFFVFTLYKIINKKPEFELDKLEIHLGDEEYDKLSKLRDEARKIGYLKRSKDDFVPMDINYLNQNISGETRLKGDWTDHLIEDKWSFRIKLEQPMDDGLQVFSVQNPKSRDFLNAYVYHQLLKEEGVLSNEYRFIELMVNGESWGIYCLEEHLTDRMLSSQNKPKGVILKFKDDVFFDAAIDSLETTGLVMKSKIKVYGAAKKDAVYETEVSQAKSIIKDYQFQKSGLYTNFDPEVTGKYYALCDLGTAYHAMGWINIRFYFNFETKKMEPIGYDAYPVLEWGKPYLGKKALEANLDPFHTEMMVYEALRDSSIYSEYTLALDRITSQVYIDAFFEKHIKDLEFIETQIQKEYTDYKYDYNFISNRAKEIREFRKNEQ